MKTVWKYNIRPDDLISLDLPIGAKPLSIQEQHGNAELWCLCDPNEKVYETRLFRMAGTGHSIKEEIIGYVGTFQLDGGSLVFHLFEVM